MFSLPLKYSELPDLDGVECLFRSWKNSMILNTLHLDQVPQKMSFKGYHNKSQSFDSNRLN